MTDRSCVKLEDAFGGKLERKVADSSASKNNILISLSLVIISIVILTLIMNLQGDLNADVRLIDESVSHPNSCVLEPSDNLCGIYHQKVPLEEAKSLVSESGLGSVDRLSDVLPPNYVLKSAWVTNTMAQTDPKATIISLLYAPREVPGSIKLGKVFDAWRYIKDYWKFGHWKDWILDTPGGYVIVVQKAPPNFEAKVLRGYVGSEISGSAFEVRLNGRLAVIGMEASGPSQVNTLIWLDDDNLFQVYADGEEFSSNDLLKIANALKGEG